jgi:hypothetical protein
MARCAPMTLLTTLAFGLAGCNDSAPQAAVDALPKLPQIMPNAQEGVIGFLLKEQGDAQTIDAVFVNGGMDPLIISNAEITSDTHHVFSMEMPASTTIESRRAIGYPITFTSPGRGIYLADFVVTSNAANFPTLTLQLVAPGAGLDILDYPDIEPFETSVQIQNIPGASVPAALVRIYNLGGASLELMSYTLADTANFRFLVGTAIPGDVCKRGATCTVKAATAAAPDLDGEGCCGALECLTETSQPLVGVCSSVLIARGRFVLFGLTWADAATPGLHTTDLSIASNDTHHPVLTVTVSGTR